jgi:type I restriction enzyme S subunit
VIEESLSLVVALHHSLAGTRVVRLGDVLVLDEDRHPIEVGNSYPQIGVRGYGQGLFLKTSVDSSQTTYKTFNRLYEGAVVLSQPKGWEGAIAVVPAEYDGVFASPEYRTFRCIPDVLIPEYLAAVVPTPWFHGHLTNLSRGVGARRERTRPEQFLGLEMPMPEIAQQRQALGVLRMLAALKPLQAETLVALDSLLPAALDRLFGGRV